MVTVCIRAASSSCKPLQFDNGCGAAAQLTHQVLCHVLVDLLTRTRPSVCSLRKPPQTFLLCGTHLAHSIPPNASTMAFQADCTVNAILGRDKVIKMGLLDKEVHRYKHKHIEPFTQPQHTNQLREPRHGCHVFPTYSCTIKRERADVHPLFLLLMIPCFPLPMLCSTSSGPLCSQLEASNVLFGA